METYVIRAGGGWRTADDLRVAAETLDRGGGADEATTSAGSAAT